jgi:dTDP-4-dehydrorhamnose 3,5-epimerase
MIDGVIVKKLKVIADERGYLMEMLRADDAFFKKFGQVYLTVAYPGVVKGWHYHKKQTDHFVAVSGMVKVVLHDRRKDSKTHGETNEFFMGELNPILLVIPPLVAHGMKGIGTKPGMVVNCTTEPYAYDGPDEYRIDPHGGEIPYDWERKDG